MKRLTAGAVIDSRFEILEEVGHGGMGIVYRARQKDIGRDVAIKILRDTLAAQPEKMKRFQREAQVISKLDHPNIVRVYAVGVEEGQPYIAMEYLHGRQLSDIIHENGPLPWRTALPLFVQACDALSYAHQHNIIHRDIKPSNIVVANADEVKIVDFGIAKSLDAKGEKLTQTEVVLGSVFYLSPGQFQGRGAEPSSDIYGLGCTFFEVLTGQPPFPGDTVFDTMAKKVENQIPSVNKVCPTALIPDSLQKILVSMMQSESKNRAQSAEQVKEWLKKVEQDQTVDIDVSAAPTVIKSRNTTNTAMLILALGAGLALLAFAGTQLLHQRTKANLVTGTAREATLLERMDAHRKSPLKLADDYAELANLYTVAGYPEQGALAAEQGIGWSRPRTAEDAGQSWHMCKYRLAVALDQLGEPDAALPNVIASVDHRRSSFPFEATEEKVWNHLLSVQYIAAVQTWREMAKHADDAGDRSARSAGNTLVAVYPAIIAAPYYSEAYNVRNDYVRATQVLYNSDSIRFEAEFLPVIAEMGTTGHTIDDARWLSLRKRVESVPEPYSRVKLLALAAQAELIRAQPDAAQATLAKAASEALQYQPGEHAFPSAIFQKLIMSSYCAAVLDKMPPAYRANAETRVSALQQQCYMMRQQKAAQRRHARLPISDDLLSKG